MARRPDRNAVEQTAPPLATPQDSGDTAGTGDAADRTSKLYRKKELVDAVTASSGIKKKTVKPVVDAVLRELGVALSRGDVLNMPPLGKMQVNRSKEGPSAEVLIVKIRRLKVIPGDAGPAPDGDDDDAVEAAE